MVTIGGSTSFAPKMTVNVGGYDPYSVVLADVKLSGEMTGFELSRGIRQTHPNIDVILTSGVAGAVAEAHDLCHDGPIKKPYHPKDVESRIRILLERRRNSQHSKE